MDIKYMKGPNTIEDSLFMVLAFQLASVEKIMSNFWEKWRNPPVFKSNKKRAEFG